MLRQAFAAKGEKDQPSLFTFGLKTVGVDGRVPLPDTAEPQEPAVVSPNKRALESPESMLRPMEKEVLLYAEEVLLYMLIRLQYSKRLWFSIRQTMPPRKAKNLWPNICSHHRNRIWVRQTLPPIKALHMAQIFVDCQHLSQIYVWPYL